MSIKASASFSLADRLFNRESVAQLSQALKRAYPKFALKNFEREVLDRFPDLTLKARIDWMVVTLGKYLPDDFNQSVSILENALPPPLDPNRTDNDFGQFIWATPGEYVARFGCTAEALDLSLGFLRKATMRFSSESAIRPFLSVFPQPTLEFMQRCARDENYHVRRFASEGTRPFLPWAQRVDLPLEELVTILDLLHDDSTRYVTRSVANAINDITRIDAQIALHALKRWQKSKRQQPGELEWMIRHATRTLLKQGHPEALRLLGYSAKPRVELNELRTTKEVQVGETFCWQCKLVSKTRQKLKITLHIHFLKASGDHAPKVFTVRDAECSPNQSILINKRQSFKPITTLTLYPGRHYAELVINGVSFAKRPFELNA